MIFKDGLMASETLSTFNHLIFKMLNLNNMKTAEYLLFHQLSVITITVF